MPLEIAITVVPSSGKKGCILTATQKLKCFLTSPPEKGKANKELIKMLAKKLRIPQGAITIVRGQTSRSKHLVIDAELTREQLVDRLGIVQQMKLV